MARFIKSEDYSHQVKNEVFGLLVSGYEDSKLLKNENAAISQIKNHLADRYDTDKVFSGENRDDFIVMITIDITLYHLYSSEASNRLPDHRSQRYEDALNFLRRAGRGEIGTILPPKTEGYKSSIRVWSRKPKNHKW